METQTNKGLKTITFLDKTRGASDNDKNKDLSHVKSKSK